MKRVSKSWRDAADACLARYNELRIGRFDFPAVLEDTSLETLLRAMPALKCLSIDWRLDREKLDIDVVSRYCRNLVEIDLTRFRLDTWSLQQLCVACPKLEVVKLPRKCDDSCVEVLLRNLSHLRSLDLANSAVTSRFLAQENKSVERLSLAGCDSLKLEHLRVVHSIAGDPSQQVVCWTQVRELDLSSTTVTSTDVADAFKHFPQLERLSFAHCSKLDSASLLHAALCERLRDLDVSHVGSVQASDLITLLTRCSQLERLALAGCKVLGPACLGSIGQTSGTLRLRELDVSAVRGLAITDLTAVLALSPQLECLHAPNFENMEMTACLIEVSKCIELCELDVSHPGSDLKRRLIDSAALNSLLLNCPKLERLLLAGCQLYESAGLRQLVQCPKLRELDLSEAAGLSVADLAQGLGGCLLLERLSVAGLGASLEQLVPPTGLPRLVYLNASKSGLTNNSLRRLSGLFPKLHTLNMMGCKALMKGSLLAYLPRLQQLHSLDLRSVPNVTEALFNKLKGSHLVKLRVDEESLKERGQINTKPVTEFALDCPSLKYLWLSVSENVFKPIKDAIKKQQTPDQPLVLCVGKGNLSPREYLSVVNSQPGPLWVVDAGTADWDDASDVTVSQGQQATNGATNRDGVATIHARNVTGIWQMRGVSRGPR